jgi:hypothetical protein
MTTETFMHIWLHGDRIYCLACGRDVDDLRFVEPGRPLCGDCRRREAGEQFAAPIYCSRHRRSRS